MDFPFPKIIANTLERHGYLAISKDEYERLSAPQTPTLQTQRSECPYPLHREKFGMTHREYITTISHDNNGGDVLVVRCSACQAISFERPVALAAG